MAGKITRVQHRHGRQGEGARDLVLEVGKQLPSFYQKGRTIGLRVVGFVEGFGSIDCILSNGEMITISANGVSDTTRGVSDT